MPQLDSAAGSWGWDIDPGRVIGKSGQEAAEDDDRISAGPVCGLAVMQHTQRQTLSMPRDTVMA